MKKLIIFISIVFIFFGCTKEKKLQAPIKVLPTWYQTPKVNTQQYIYANANGLNKDQAISRALKDIVGQFGISVESSFESNTNISRGNGSKYSSDVKSNIKTKVENIKINNYELINSYSYRYNQFLVQIRVDKLKLNEYLKTDIKRKFKELNSKEDSIKNENFITKLNTYINLYNKSNSYKNILSVIKSIDEDFDDASYHNIIAKYKKEYLTLQNNFTISFSSKENTKLFEKKLKIYLISKDIKISNQKVNLHTNIKIKKHYVNNENYNLIVFNITLELYSKDKLIGNNTIEIKEFNTGKLNRIEQKASQKFYNEIEEKSFLEIFNISI